MTIAIRNKILGTYLFLKKKNVIGKTLLPLLLSIFIFSCAEQTSLKDKGLTDFPEESIQTLAYAYELQRQAYETQDPEKNELLLKSLYIYLKLRNIQQAELTLEKLNYEIINSDQEVLISIAQADVFLFHGDEKNALSILNKKIDPSTLNLELQALYANTKASAYFQNNEIVNGVKELIFISPVLKKDDRDLNNKLIWENLSHLNSEQLSISLNSENDNVLKGWIELISIKKTYQNNLNVEIEKFKEWKKIYTNHDAIDFVDQQIDVIRNAQKNSPKKIAFLLPESGPFAKSANAIKYGFLNNYYLSQSEEPIELFFFNTDDKSLKERAEYILEGDTQEKSDSEKISIGFLSIYNEAINSGVDLIIGPIDKTQIDLLNASDGKFNELPILALNYSATNEIRNNKLYQFGLAPEDDIDFISQQALLRNFSNVAILSPSGEWGDRLTQAFSDSWHKKGGNVVSVASYSDTRTLTKLIQKMLNIDQSENRFRKLYWFSGSKVQFQSRRRQDVDFIYLIATPEMGRQIMPTFAFLDATDIPVFSNSTIYAGEHDVRDKDLNRLMFTEIPGIMNPDENTLNAWESQDFRYRRLIAMGMDTYNLALRLTILEDSKANAFYGETGTLYMGENQKIRRIPILARFYGSFARPQASIY